MHAAITDCCEMDVLSSYRVKDTLFSYQPPFNMLAFAVLWPLSFVLSPRALHSTNVFLIKLTVSGPRLVAIIPAR